MAPTTACVSHDRGINVGVSDCHQNRSASDEPVSVGVPNAPRRSVSGVPATATPVHVTTIFIRKRSAAGVSSDLYYRSFRLPPPLLLGLDLLELHVRL